MSTSKNNPMELGSPRLGRSQVVRAPGRTAVSFFQGFSVQKIGEVEITKGAEHLDLFDVEAAEKAEASIDAFILKRCASQEAANREEELWVASSRAFNQKRHHQNAWAWYDHHDRQLCCHEATFGQLVAYHRGERARYAQILGIVADGDERDDGPPEAA